MSNELDQIITGLQNKFGKELVKILDYKLDITNNDSISSGVIGFDLASGVLGLLRGRIYEFFGSESSGKTTFLLNMIAKTQAQGGICGIIDAEHSLDPNWCIKLGVNIKNLIISQPSSAEESLEILETMIETKKFSLIGIDSVAALVPKTEIENDFGDSTIGLQARLMSQALRKLIGKVSKTNTIVIFLNQVRDKIGGSFYSNNETTTGGNALKFYASARLRFKKLESIKNGDVVKGQKIKIEFVKNKVAPPFTNCNIDILFDTGIDFDQSLIDIAIKYNIVTKLNSWYSYNNERIGQGVESVKKLLNEKPEIREEIRNKIISVVVEKGLACD